MLRVHLYKNPIYLRIQDQNSTFLYFCFQELSNFSVSLMSLFSIMQYIWLWQTIYLPLIFRTKFYICLDHRMVSSQYRLQLQGVIVKQLKYSSPLHPKLMPFLLGLLMGYSSICNQKVKSSRY